MIGTQLIGVGFGIFMLYLTFIYSKKKQFTGKEWLSWSVIWSSLIVLSLFPNLLNPFIPLFRLARALDFFMIVACLLFAGLLFYLYSICRGLQKKMETLTTRLAIMNNKINQLKQEKKD